MSWLDLYLLVHQIQPTREKADALISLLKKLSEQAGANSPACVSRVRAQGSPVHSNR